MSDMKNEYFICMNEYDKLSKNLLSVIFLHENPKHSLTQLTKLLINKN